MFLGNGQGCALGKMGLNEEPNLSTLAFCPVSAFLNLESLHLAVGMLRYGESCTSQPVKQNEGVVISASAA